MTSRREITIVVYASLALLSCVRKPSSDAEKHDAGREAAAPHASASTSASAAASATPKLPSSPGAVAYEDDADLPTDAGDRRCKDAPTKTASVQLELIADPPSIDLVIPSLSVRQSLWSGGGECRAPTTAESKGLRFKCIDDKQAVVGKIYSRKSDVVLGRAQMTGTTQTRFMLPCGTTAKLEPAKCPARCTKIESDCVCTKK